MYTVFKKVLFINTRWKLKLTDKLITKLYADLGSIGVIYTAVANSAAFYEHLLKFNCLSLITTKLLLL